MDVSATKKYSSKKKYWKRRTNAEEWLGMTSWGTDTCVMRRDWTLYGRRIIIGCCRKHFCFKRRWYTQKICCRVTQPLLLVSISSPTLVDVTPLINPGNIYDYLVFSRPIDDSVNEWEWNNKKKSSCYYYPVFFFLLALLVRQDVLYMCVSV